MRTTIQQYNEGGYLLTVVGEAAIAVCTAVWYDILVVTEAPGVGNLLGARRDAANEDSKKLLKVPYTYGSSGTDVVGP